MKTTTTIKTLMAMALLAVAANHANATSWRINNDVTKNAHFTDINAAMSSSDVVDGDTLYLDPGCVITSTQTISKRITLIGTGWVWASNAYQIAKVGELLINVAKVKVEGVWCTSSITIRGDYVTLERCMVNGSITSSAYFAAVKPRYINIRQCRCYGSISGVGSTSDASIGWTIENCIIDNNNDNGTVSALYNPIITNNIIWNTSTTTSSTRTPSALRGISGGIIRNNILLNVKNTRAQTLWWVENSIVQNNVMSQDEVTLSATYPDNTFLDMDYSDAMSVLFTLESETSQHRYRLKDNSPAKGAGADGEDCGAFAGNYPLVDNGYPLGIPVITSSTIGVRAVDGKVSVKQTAVIQND